MPTTTPSEHSTNQELLDCIDDALRNGRLMTRANLAFSFLCSRMGFDRDVLPTFKEDKENGVYD